MNKVKIIDILDDDDSPLPSPVFVKYVNPKTNKQKENHLKVFPTGIKLPFSEESVNSESNKQIIKDSDSSSSTKKVDTKKRKSIEKMEREMTERSRPLLHFRKCKLTDYTSFQYKSKLQKISKTKDSVKQQNGTSDSISCSSLSATTAERSIKTVSNREPYCIKKIDSNASQIALQQQNQTFIKSKIDGHFCQKGSNNTNDLNEHRNSLVDQYKMSPSSAKNSKAYKISLTSLSPKSNPALSPLKTSTESPTKLPTDSISEENKSLKKDKSLYMTNIKNYDDERCTLSGVANQLIQANNTFISESQAQPHSFVKESASSEQLKNEQDNNPNKTEKEVVCIDPKEKVKVHVDDGRTEKKITIKNILETDGTTISDNASKNKKSNENTNVDPEKTIIMQKTINENKKLNSRQRKKDEESSIVKKKQATKKQPRRKKSDSTNSIATIASSKTLNMHITSPTQNKLECSDRKIEKSLILQLQKLEKNIAWIESQRKKVARQLKKHRTSFLKKKFPDLLNDSASSLGSRFLADADVEKEYEMFLRGDPAIHEEHVKNVQSAMFAYKKKVQPTLIQLMSPESSKSKTKGKRLNDSTSKNKLNEIQDGNKKSAKTNSLDGDSNSNSDNATKVEVEDDLEKMMEIFEVEESKEELLDHYSGSILTTPSARISRKGLEWLSTGMKSNEFRSEAPTSLELSKSKKNNHSHDRTDECMDKAELCEMKEETTLSGKNVDCETDKLNIAIGETLSSMEEGGMEYLLELFRDCSNGYENRDQDNHQDEDFFYASQDTSTATFALQSQLTQRGQEIVKMMEEKIMENPKKLKSIESACPSWKENIRYAQLRTDKVGIEKALNKVQLSLQNIQTMKRSVIQCCLNQESVLELFEQSLIQALCRLDAKDEKEEQIQEIPNIDDDAPNTIIELSDDDCVIQQIPKDKSYDTESILTMTKNGNNIKCQTNENSKLSPILSDDDSQNEKLPNKLDGCEQNGVVPDFSKMDINTLQKMLSDYGFRSAPREEMISRLTEIFRQQNKNSKERRSEDVRLCSCTDSQENADINVAELQEKNVEEMPNYSAMNLEELKRLTLNYGFKPASRKQMVYRLIQIYNEMKSSKSNSESIICNETQTKSKQTIPKCSQAMKNNSVDESDSIKCKASKSNDILFAKCSAVLKNNETLHLSILERETVELTQIKECLDQNGVKISKSQLIDFLDEQGICVWNPWRQKAT